MAVCDFLFTFNSNRGSVSLWIRDYEEFFGLRPKDVLATL